ncbi:hypothetical protein D1159_04125 [Pseudoflavonifractor sp. 524-17]|nr:hypothetical protein [Pseudoflavonifractor sp. 524-17]
MVEGLGRTAEKASASRGQEMDRRSPPPLPGLSVELGRCRLQIQVVPRTMFALSRLAQGAFYSSAA